MGGQLNTFVDPAVIWLIVGTVLIFLEVVVPGAILCFVGMAALVVSGLHYYGILDSIFYGLITWLITSLFLVLFLRSFALRFMPSEHRFEPVNEDDNAEGSKAEVLVGIGPERAGRIRFRGTTWEAVSGDHCLPGDTVCIAGREGNAWKVQLIKGEETAC